MKKILLMMLFVNGLLFANIQELSSGVAESSTVAKGETKQYKIHLDAGKKIVVNMDNLDADADLYLNIGESATTSKYACRSYKGENNAEICSLDIAEASDIFIGVYGYQSASYRLQATVTDLNITTLQSGVSVSGSVEKDTVNYYKIAVEADSKLKSLLDHLSADADIRVKIGEKPTVHNFDCKSLKGQIVADECSVTVTQNADVYIGVYGYKSATYQLTSTILEAESVVTLESTVVKSGSVENGDMKYYMIPAKTGERVDSLLDALTADADIYVRVGEKPTKESFDCKSTHGGTNSDGCSVTLDRDTNVYIGIYGYKAAEYEVKATIVNNNPNPNNDLITGVNDSVEMDKTKYYTIHLEANRQIKVVLDQLTADADLFLQVDAQPTNLKSACKSTHGGVNSEECTFALKEAGDIHIGIFGFRPANYRLKATISTIPEGDKVIEDAEGGELDPNWRVLKGDYVPLYYPRSAAGPHAPAGTGVITFPCDSGPGTVEYYTSYALTTNDSVHKVLELDLGGIPTRVDAHYKDREDKDLRGYTTHFALGVEVETLDGTRRMSWDSWFTHQNVGPHRSVGNWLDYPSSVEMVRGWRTSLDRWDHFKVDLEQQLKLIEPDNRIIKVNYFFTLGGTMDNIKLTSNYID